jgi:hypothetical protein
LAEISAEQRLHQVKARDEMLAEAEKLTEDEKKTLAEHLSTRDRLMRRLYKRKVITTFKDDLGDFTVETRLLTGKERARFLDFNKQLSEAASDADKYNAAMTGLKELAADISLTSGLEREFWLGDEVSDDVVLTIILNTFNGAAQAVREGVASFRP